MNSLQPGDWVCRNDDDHYPQIAQVKDVHTRTATLDLVFYSATGDRIGRTSPAMGGPRGFEPCCAPENWGRIEAPNFEAISKDYRYGWRHHIQALGD